MRDKACEAHREYLLSVLGQEGSTAREVGRRHKILVDSHFGDENPDDLRREIEALADRVRKGEKIRLLCWCHPKRCHAHALAAALSKLSSTEPAEKEEDGLGLPLEPQSQPG